MTRLVKIADLPDLVGKELEPSPWFEITQERVKEIAEKRPGQWLMKTDVSVEIEGEETPALIAEILSMMIVA